MIPGDPSPVISCHFHPLRCTIWGTVLSERSVQPSFRLLSAVTLAVLTHTARESARPLIENPHEFAIATFYESSRGSLRILVQRREEILSLRFQSTLAEHTVGNIRPRKATRTRTYNTYVTFATASCISVSCYHVLRCSFYISEFLRAKARVSTRVEVLILINPADFVKLEGPMKNFEKCYNIIQAVVLP